eukprot:4233961-Pyramimonas_sp.AAC.1
MAQAANSGDLGGAGGAGGGPHGGAAGRGGSGHGHYRPRLGAHHENRLCYRHQPRRPRASPNKPS